MNLPNSLTAGRIAIMPLIAWLPFTPSAAWRMVGFALFIVAAVTDYYDGMLARTRNSVTDLGRLLDPLADKLLLLGTMLPMYALMAPPDDATMFLSAVRDAGAFPFVTPLGEIPLPWWIVAVVLGRELFMTVFRQVAARRGLVISAIGPAKWKMGFQCTWVGAAYFWFSVATAARTSGWSGPAWTAFAMVIGVIGTLSMIGAFGLTLASLWLYMRRYGPFVLFRRPVSAATPGAGPGRGPA